MGVAFPSLAGLPQAYTAEQLRAWKTGARPAGPLGLMPAIAKKLSEDDISAVARYFADSPPRSRRRADEHSIIRAGDPGAGARVACAVVASGTARTRRVARGCDRAGQRRVLAAPVHPAAGELHPGHAVGRYDPAWRGHLPEYRKGAAPAVRRHQLDCNNCHLGRRRLAHSAPLWAAWVSFPAFREKNGHVNTFAERLQGCFRFKYERHRAAARRKVLVALQQPILRGSPRARRWEEPPGRGYPRLAAPATAPDYARGQQVYAQQCALCHGPDGAGQSPGAGRVPPLWGPHSYNWGAGMDAARNAAGFIKANMPLGLSGSLSDQEAWDVAMFVDSQERPQDPRLPAPCRRPGPSSTTRAGPCMDKS